MSRAVNRQWRVVNGVLEAQCACCRAFKPADRKHFYMQRNKVGRLVAHSWCKACYLTNSGRGAGMRKKLPETSIVPAGIAAVQAAFVMLPARSACNLVATP